MSGFVQLIKYIRLSITIGWAIANKPNPLLMY